MQLQPNQKKKVSDYNWKLLSNRCECFLNCTYAHSRQSIIGAGTILYKDIQANQMISQRTIKTKPLKRLELQADISVH